MRVSEFFDLKRTQSTLDFVDVDTVNDIPVYIDPSAVRHLPDEWGEECMILLGTFFDSVLAAIRANDKPLTRHLLGNLGEPNETHLGISRGKSAGRGFGKKMREQFIERLYSSHAAHTGLIADLEDTAFFIDKVGKDIVSDITTNIIRGPLISYTQQQAVLFGIPLEEIQSGAVWDAQSRSWEQGYTQLPTTDGEKLLLVPKVIVRRSMYLSRTEYYNNHLIPVLQSEEESNPASRLATTVKGGGRHVTKKAIKAFYGNRKDDYTRLSLQRKEVYYNYKRIKSQVEPDPITHEDLSEAGSTPPPDYRGLLEDLLSTPTGKKDAHLYHSRAEALLSALFYPSLAMPEMEEKLHEGRKRVDIGYTNVATKGFFHHLILHKIRSRQIFVECKNYGQDVENPELDQLSGRFSALRGKFGFLASRSFKDKELFLRRCRDTAQDRRGYIIALDDNDMQTLVEDAIAALEWDPASATELGESAPPPIHEYPLLYKRLKALEN